MGVVLMAKTTTEMQLVPLSKLVPYINNARTHSPEQITKLRSSLREFGFVNPVIIDRDYGIIAGHGRVMAAKEEGIELKTLCNPTKILDDGNGRAGAIECIRMELGEPDASGRRRPVAIEGSEFQLEVDTVIMALGTSPNPLIRSTTPGLETNKKGCLIVNEDNMTTREGVYAGGDAVTGAATVILAMGAGKKAAAAIDASFQK